jgi:hypothetical protein
VFDLAVRKNGELHIVCLDRKTCPQKWLNAGFFNISLFKNFPAFA